jgi:hypothetical protein
VGSRRAFGMWVSLAGLGVGGCTRHLVANEIKLVGFEENVKKGKSVGEIDGDDCVFTILGVRLGGSPTVGAAIQNARLQRKSEIGDVAGGAKTGDALRYINNLHIEPGGFDAFVFAKDCLEVKGMGYK